MKFYIHIGIVFLVLIQTFGCGNSLEPLNPLPSGVQKVISNNAKNIEIGIQVQKPNAKFELTGGHGHFNNTIQVKVTLPLHINTNKITGDIPFGGGMEPSAGHLYTAKQSYKVHDVQSEVMEWTKTHFISEGFQLDGTGQSGSVKDKSLMDFFSFRSKMDPNFTITVSFANQKNNTLMEYALDYVYTSPRTAESEISQQISSINLSLGKQGQDAQRRIILDPSKMATIVSNLNELPLDSGGIKGCTMDDGTRLTLTFTLSDGKQLQAIENPACSSVLLEGKYDLVDKELSLYGYLKNLITN